MILNPRGTNGSGKSTIARAFMRPEAEVFRVCSQTLPSPTKKDPDRMKDYYIVAQEGINGIAILGSYKNNCGGMDEFSWKGSHDAMCDAIRILAREFRHVLFEGITVSSVFTRYLNLAIELWDADKIRTHWLMISPPLETCLQRVSARTGREIDQRMRDNVGMKHRVVEHTATKLDDMGLAGDTSDVRGLSWSLHVDNDEALRWAQDLLR